MSSWQEPDTVRLRLRCSTRARCVALPLQVTVPLVYKKKKKALCSIVIVTAAVCCGLSPCLGFTQMGSDSIHNSFDLGKVTITEGNSAIAKHRDRSCFGLGKGGCDLIHW